MPRALDEGKQRRQRVVRGGRQNAVVGVLELLQRRLQQVGRVRAARVGVERFGVAVADVQPVERAGRGAAVQHLQLAQLLLRQRRLVDSAERREEVRHQPRFAARPLALERAFERRERLVRVRPGLVLKVGGAALDHQFQQVERPLIDRRFRDLAHLFDPLHEFVRGGLVAHLVEYALHALEERVHLRGGVADHAVGQHRQQIEVVRRLVELLQLPQVVLRRSRLLEQRLEEVQHFRVELRRQVPRGAAPRAEVDIDAPAQLVFTGRAVHGDLRLLVFRAAVLDQVPVRERAVRGRRQFVGRFERLELLDRVRHLALFREQVTECEPPAVVRVGAAHPLRQFRFQFRHAVERDEQPVLLGAPAGVVRFVLQLLIDVLHQPLDERRVGTLAGGEVLERHQHAGAERLVQSRFDARRVVIRIGFHRRGRQYRPAVVGDLLEVAVEQHVDPHALGGDPVRERFGVLSDLLAEPVRERLRASPCGTRRASSEGPCAAASPGVRRSSRAPGSGLRASRR